MEEDSIRQSPKCYQRKFGKCQEQRIQKQKDNGRGFGKARPKMPMEEGLVKQVPKRKW